MLLETVITITDGYFTGNYVGEHALAAINLGLPILYFYLGAGLCVGVGGSVISGRFLGAKEKQKASEVFSQTMVTAVCVCIMISCLAFVLFTPILQVLRADAGLSGYFTEYYRIMLFTYPFMVAGTVLGMFIRVDGRPQVCMIVSIAGCILNVLLDYIFVGVLGLGVQGSAIGSLLVQIFTVLVSLGYFLSKKAEIRFRRFRFDRMTGREMILNGSSEFIGEMSSATSMFAFNYVLMKYVGAEGVAAFTILGFVVNSMYFTSCGDAGSSAIISALRGMVLLLGFTLILPAIFGMTGVWMSAPCTESLTAIVSAWLLRRQKNRMKWDESDGKQREHDHTECSDQSGDQLYF